MRLAVLADIHGNLPALEAVLIDLTERRIDAVADLGDCVSGPLWPRETLDLLRRMRWPTVRGNHDRWVAAKDAAGLGPSDRYARAALDREALGWLGNLPATRIIAPGIVAMHARPDDDDAYLLEDQWGERLVAASAATVRARLGNLDADVVLTAHSHQSRALKLPGGPWVVNPGSVGCPAYHDDASDPPHMSEQGSPAARYAVVETRAEGLMIEMLSISYAHDRAADRALANGRPDWAHALRTGFMPREDAFQ